METVLLLSADSWELKDEHTGEIRRGVTVTYVNNYREPDGRSVGLRPIKAPATADVFSSVRPGGAPGLYSLDFRTRPGKESKPVLTVTRADLVEPLALFQANAPDRQESRLAQGKKT